MVYLTGSIKIVNYIDCSEMLNQACIPGIISAGS